MAESISLTKSDRGNIYKEDADNVWAVELTLEEARDLAGSYDLDELDGAIDEAQGHVFQEKAHRAYVIIKISV